MNQDEMTQRLKEIEAWKRSADAAEGGKCPLEPIPAIRGRRLAYSNNLEDFLQVI